MMLPSISGNDYLGRHVIAAVISIFIVVAGTVAPNLAVAAQKCEFVLTNAQMDERRTHLKGLLKEKRYAALEDEFEAKQLKVQRGVLSDEMLRLDFEAAFDNDMAIEPLLSEWVNLYPRSYSARIARAYHYVSSGYAKRGDRFASETSREQFEAMERQFEKARADLDQALHLNEKSTLAHAKQLGLARSTGAYGGVDKVLDEANKKFGKSLAIKVAAVVSLNPKWGGSFEKLDRLVEFAKASGMGIDAVTTLKFRVEIEKGNYYEVATKQLARATHHYRLAGEVCETYLPWEAAMRTSYEIEDWDNLIIAADRLLKLDPTIGWAIQRRGWAFEKTGKMIRAIKDYDVAADLGNPWAQNKLGWILWQGTDAPKDKIRAKLLFEQAAVQGNSNAQANLKALNAELGKH